MQIPPSLVLGRCGNDNTPRRALCVWRAGRCLPWDMERRLCSGEGFEDFESGESHGTQGGEYRGGQEVQHVSSNLLGEKQRLCKEAIVWKHVSCPYILEFNGAFYRDGVPAIVTPWMPHGNITEYLEKYPDADRLRLVNLNALAAPGTRSIRASLCVGFRCDRGGQVPPYPRLGAWGHRNGKPSSQQRIQS